MRRQTPAVLRQRCSSSPHILGCRPGRARHLHRSQWCPPLAVGSRTERQCFRPAKPWPARTCQLSCRIQGSFRPPRLLLQVSNSIVPGLAPRKTVSPQPRRLWSFCPVLMTQLRTTVRQLVGGSDPEGPDNGRGSGCTAALGFRVGSPRSLSHLPDWPVHNFRNVSVQSRTVWPRIEPRPRLSFDCNRPSRDFVVCQTLSRHLPPACRRFRAHHVSREPGFGSPSPILLPLLPVLACGAVLSVPVAGRVDLPGPCELLLAPSAQTGCRNERCRYPFGYSLKSCICRRARWISHQLIPGLPLVRLPSPAVGPQMNAWRHPFGPDSPVLWCSPHLGMHPIGPDSPVFWCSSHLGMHPGGLLLALASRSLHRESRPLRLASHLEMHPTDPHSGPLCFSGLLLGNVPILVVRGLVLCAPFQWSPQICHVLRLPA